MRRIFIAFLVVLIVYCRAVTIQEQRQMMMATAQECKPKTGATDDDISFLLLKKPMKTREGKCFVACIFETMGVIEGVKLNEKKFIEFVSVAAKNDAGIIKKMADIAAECAKISETDQCEMVVKSMACLKKGMAEKKIKTDIGI